MTWHTTLWSHEWAIMQWGVVIGASLLAAVTDIRTRRIPNRLTGPMLLGGLVWAVGVGGFAGFADAMAACLLLGFPYFVLFAVAGGGAGDSKMMGAIGAWMGVIGGTAVLVSVAICGAVLGLAWTLWRGRLRAFAGNMRFLLTGWALLAVSRGRIPAPSAAPNPSEPMPYGLAICLGTIVAAGGTWLWQIA